MYIYILWRTIEKNIRLYKNNCIGLQETLTLFQVVIWLNLSRRFKKHFMKSCYRRGLLRQLNAIWHILLLDTFWGYSLDKKTA